MQVLGTILLLTVMTGAGMNADAGGPGDPLTTFIDTSLTDPIGRQAAGPD